MSKFKDNVPGFPGYHVTKDGEVYSMKYRTRTYCRICGKKKNENKESKSNKR